MTYHPLVPKCPYCNHDEFDVEPRSWNGEHWTILKCDRCDRTWSTVLPMIQQLTIEGYIKQVKETKELNEAIDREFNIGYEEARQAALEERTSYRTPLKDVWHRAMQYMSKWWRVDKVASSEEIKQSNNEAYEDLMTK